MRPRNYKHSEERGSSSRPHPAPKPCPHWLTVSDRTAHWLWWVRDPNQLRSAQLIFGCKTIQGWAAGTPAASEDTLHFCVMSGVRPMIETYPLDNVAEGYARMMSGKAQFRVVLTM